MNSDEVKILEDFPGTGVEAGKGALCFVQYDGYLDDGTLFDSSRKHGRPFEFALGSKKVIVGWSQGILGMKEVRPRES